MNDNPSAESIYHKVYKGRIVKRPEDLIISDEEWIEEQLKQENDEPTNLK